MAGFDDPLVIRRASAIDAEAIAFSRLATLGGGDERICVAILDGPVDLSHPCFRGAMLTELSTGASSTERRVSNAHGTHVASMLFGQPDTTVVGLTPRCRGLIVPVFTTGNESGSLSCSQLDLARALLLAVENGADIINISGGQLSTSGEPEPLLAKALEACANKDVLVVAAAGNDGCDCLHIPAATPSVLAVGALDGDGAPLPSSNWGSIYQSHGIMAPGTDMLGASSTDEGIARRTGTSFATPIVSGVAALLACLQLNRGSTKDMGAVRISLLKSATPCLPAVAADCRKFLAGSLNINGAIELINKGAPVMTEQVSSISSQNVALALSDCDATVGPPPTDIDVTGVSGQLPSAETGASQLSLSDCGCGGAGQAPQAAPAKPSLIYALGRLGYDFGTEARRDSFIQAMGGREPGAPANLLSHLRTNPSDAGSIIWTLNLDATPIYAIQPAGAFAASGYERLREFLEGQISKGVELVSIPGVIGGSVRLQSGQIVPVVVPALRGMYCWASVPLAKHVLGERPKATAAVASYDSQISRLTGFLDRVYYDLRNLGLTAEDRALNYAATNALQAAEVIRSTTQNDYDLDDINVRKSPVCRPDSDCYDVELSFFNPNNTRTANRIFRFTVDVSDIIPVTIGSIRSWTRKQ